MTEITGPILGLRLAHSEFNGHLDVLLLYNDLGACLVDGPRLTMHEKLQCGGPIGWKERDGDARGIDGRGERDPAECGENATPAEGRVG